MQGIYEEILKEHFPSYDDFELEEKENMLEEVFLRKFYNGEEIMDDFFNPLNSLVIIISGSANILTESGTIQSTLSTGDFFGDTAPIYNNNPSSSLTVSSDTMTALCFPSHRCKVAFGMRFGKMILMKHVQKAIENDEILKDL